MQSLKLISQYNPTPVRIFIIRHGESAANVDRKIYGEEIDSKISLTQNGWQQALACGHFLRNFFDGSPPKGDVEAWLSPYYRTRQTLAGILEGAGAASNGISIVNRIHETDCFAEIRHGVLDALGRKETAKNFPDETKLKLLYKAANAEYFYRDIGGESRSDVSIRCRAIFGAMNHSYKDNGVTDFVIVCHNITARCFANVWLGRRYEDLDEAGKPSNCSIRLIDTQIDYGYIFQDGEARKVLEPINTVRAEDYYMTDVYRPAFAKEPDAITLHE